jgi:4-methyl-5(b-hydroxyethyl)-thiazole monophosphate biosynthesis
MDAKTKTALVPIADGTEEIEAVCIIDTLRRAEITVTVASVGDLQITASRDVKLVADTTLTECEQQTFDLIALPGGLPGADHLAACESLINMLRIQQKARRLIGAICASPAVVLKPHGLLEGLTATCYPSFQDRLDPSQVSTEPIVVDGTMVTAQGPAFAIAFALTLIDQLIGPDLSRQVARGLLVTDNG